MPDCSELESLASQILEVIPMKIMEILQKIAKLKENQPHGLKTPPKFEKKNLKEYAVLGKLERLFFFFLEKTKTNYSLDPNMYYILVCVDRRALGALQGYCSTRSTASRPSGDGENFRWCDRTGPVQDP